MGVTESGGEPAVPSTSLERPRDQPVPALIFLGSDPTDEDPIEKEKVQMRLIQRVVVLIAVALGALVWSVAPAHADGGAYTSDGNGSVWFDSYGEHFTVNDWAPDGYGVVGELAKTVCGGPEGSHCWRQRVGSTYNTNGYHGAPAHENFSIAEGTTVHYRACLYDGDDWIGCGDWKVDEA